MNEPRTIPPRPRDRLYAAVTLVLAVLLLFPVERITPRQAYLSRRLAERAGRAIRGGQPVGHLDEDVRVLAALATAARLKTAARTRATVPSLRRPTAAGPAAEW
jgi:hypothetical protein